MKPEVTDTSEDRAVTPTSPSLKPEVRGQGWWTRTGLLSAGSVRNRGQLQVPRIFSFSFLASCPPSAPAQTAVKHANVSTHHYLIPETAGGRDQDRQPPPRPPNHATASTFKLAEPPAATGNPTGNARLKYRPNLPVCVAPGLRVQTRLGTAPPPRTRPACFLLSISELAERLSGRFGSPSGRKAQSAAVCFC